MNGYILYLTRDRNGRKIIMKKYAFYISHRSGRLYKFINQASTEVLSQIKLVVSDYDIVDELKNLLLDKQIPFVIINYPELAGDTNIIKNSELSDKMLELFEEYNIDYMFSFGSHILSGELLKKYENRLINFHPSILPMFPGKNSIDQAVNHGNTFLIGNTAHLMDEGMDTGKIIMQSVIPIQAFLEGNDYDVVLDIQIDMLNKLIYVLNEDRLIVDGKAIIKGANYNKGVIFPEI